MLIKSGSLTLTPGIRAKSRRKFAELIATSAILIRVRVRDVRPAVGTGSLGAILEKLRPNRALFLRTHRGPRLQDERNRPMEQKLQEAEATCEAFALRRHITELTQRRHEFDKDLETRFLFLCQRLREKMRFLMPSA
jgi:hypothetical protein